jgi:hypothetical protein
MKVVEEIEIRATVMVGLHWKAVAANLRLKHRQFLRLC